MDSLGEVTRYLELARAGDKQAQERLLPLLYGELKAIAINRLKGQPAHTLQPTALVHEAYLKLMDRTAAWESRAVLSSISIPSTGHGPAATTK